MRKQDEEFEQDAEDTQTSNATQVIALVFVTIVMVFLYIKIIFF
ncbi:MAG: hypothetical protein JWQ27_2845 [Ferruginibacter sp.]|nr:hypothetical protein [Ferruginibacter sp.]